MTREKSRAIFAGPAAALRRGFRKGSIASVRDEEFARLSQKRLRHEDHDVEIAYEFYDARKRKATQ
jgi:hypothetical protein